jgi:ferredoxin-thioredoxin reductase catalytic subunit
MRWRDEEKAALVTKIRDVLTSAALFPDAEVFVALVKDMVDNKRDSGVPTARWTITSPNNAENGNRLRCGNGGINGRTCYCGLPATSKFAAFTLNSRRRNKTKLTKAQHHSLLP